VELVTGQDVSSECVYGAEVVARPPAEAPAGETPEQAPGTPSPIRAPASESPSLVSRVLGALSSPFLLIGVGIGAVLLTAVWYLRNRREDVEDVTGRWDALEAELEDVQSDATGRLEALDEGALDHDPVEAAAAAATS